MTEMERQYIENPKTKGSGIVCCIPQKGVCPMGCKDCFFQSGRSYLEPLEEHLPNIPDPAWVGDRVVRMNDGNDSSIEIEKVIKCAKQYKHAFYNTSIMDRLDLFDRPVVLTLNPREMTDEHFWGVKEDNLKKLMFVRFRANMWNLNLCHSAVDYYIHNNIPVVLTFMAYHDVSDIPDTWYRECYVYRRRTMNSYWAITTDAWRMIMERFQDNILVYSCGKIEGEKGKTSCKYCGNCLREYFSTLERMKGNDSG